MANCPICSKKISNHASKLSCSVCQAVYHMKCISIDPTIIAQLNYDETWFCCNCLISMFPFNNIENTDEFISATSASNTVSSLCYLSDLLFMPFELNDSDNLADMYNNDINPDIHFFNNFQQHVTSCNYLTETSFIKATSTPRLKKQCFSLCHLNIRSIKRNLTAFENYLEILQYDFSIIGLTETWLTDYDYNLYNISGYSMVENHRSSRSGGGVAICLKDSVEYTLRKDLAVFKDHMESVFVEVDKSEFGTCRNIIIGTIYRKPDTDICQFSDEISLLLDNLYHENKIIYLLGDFNINLLNVDTHVSTSAFVDVLYSHHLFPLISRPTRITPISATLIDNIFTNNVSDFESSLNGILVTDISDHFPIFHINYSYISDEADSFMVLRVYNEKKIILGKLLHLLIGIVYLIQKKPRNHLTLFTRFLLMFMTNVFLKQRLGKSIRIVNHGCLNL